MANHLARVSHDAVRILCNDLNQLYIQINRPKFLDLQELSAELKRTTPGVRYLSKSSINDTVRGKRTRLPDWQWVSSFVTVCHIYATRNKVPRVDQLADMTYWNSRWYKAERACSDTAPLEVAGQTSSSCPTVRHGYPIWPPSDSREPSSTAKEKTANYSTPDIDSKEFTGLIGSLTARRYRSLFGEHGIELLQATEHHRDLDACCRIGILLICVGCTHEGEAWLSIAAHNGGDPVATATLRASNDQGKRTQEKQLRFAAERLYDMAMEEDCRRMRTKDTSPNNWIELYLKIGAVCCGHKDAAYRLAIRSRALGHDAEAAHWFALAARSGHHAATERFETIHQEIWNDALREEWP